MKLHAYFKQYDGEVYFRLDKPKFDRTGEDYLGEFEFNPALNCRSKELDPDPRIRAVIRQEKKRAEKFYPESMWCYYYEALLESEKRLDEINRLREMNLVETMKYLERKQ